MLPNYNRQLIIKPFHPLIMVPPSWIIETYKYDTMTPRKKTNINFVCLIWFCDISHCLYQRQSRFDQPPSGMGGGYNQGNMGGNIGGGNMGGQGNNGGMRNERGMMDRRDRPARDDFFDNKRPRRF